MTDDRSGSEHWQRLQLLFEKAIELTGDERDAYITASCADDRELEQELRELLESDRRAEEIFDELAQKTVTMVDSMNLVGKSFLQYTVIDRIGAGGMGEVYLANDTQLNRKVALKFLPAELSGNRQFRERFLREARAAAALAHPNIVTIHEVSRTDDRIFIAMEYVTGKSLGSLIRSGSLSFDQKLAFALQLCTALEKAHAAGIIHRDIKPGNIMIDSDGRLRLLDFGLASLRDQDKLTKTGAVLGTPAYMSPEQIRGQKLTETSDIFSVGSVLFELFTGRSPFRGETHAATMNAVINSEPVFPIDGDELPRELGAIFEKAMQKDSRNRFQTMTDLLRELQKIKEGRLAEVITAPSKIRRIKRIGLAAAIVTCFLIGSLVIPWSIKIQPRNEAEAFPDLLGIMYLNNASNPHDTTRTAEIVSRLLMTDISESRHIKTVGAGRLNDLLKSSGFDRKTVLEPADAELIARKMHARWFLSGEIIQTEPNIVIATQLSEASSGKLIANQRVTGSPGQSVYAIVDRLSNDIRRDLGVPVSDTAEYNLDVSSLTTSSLEAYRNYIEGLEYQEMYDRPRAKEKFLRAIEIDSSLAMAYYYLSFPKFDLPVVAMMDSAYKYAEHTTTKEKHLIAARYDWLQGDSQESVNELKAAYALDPTEKLVVEMLARAYSQIPGRQHEAIDYFHEAIELDSTGSVSPYVEMTLLYLGLGQYDSALYVMRQLQRIRPDEATPYSGLGTVYAAWRRPDSAVVYFRKALDIDPHIDETRTEMTTVFMRQGKYAEAEREFRIYATEPLQWKRSHARRLLAAIPARQGKLREAIKAIDVGISADEIESYYHFSHWMKWIMKAAYNARLGHIDTVSQIYDSLQSLVDSAFIRATPRADRHLFALFFARAGQFDKADSIRDQLYRDYSNNDQYGRINSYWFARGSIEFYHGNYADAIESLNRGLYAEYADARWAFVFKHYLGRAYMQLQEWDKAIPLFEDVTTTYNNGFMIDLPTYDVLSYYYLGIAYQESGEPKKAVAPLTEFVDTWKDADPELQSYVTDARQRLSKIH